MSFVVSEIGRGNISGFDWSMEVIINGGVWSEVAASVMSTDGLACSIRVYNPAIGNREDLAEEHVVRLSIISMGGEGSVKNYRAESVARTLAEARSTGEVRIETFTCPEMPSLQHRCQ